MEMESSGVWDWSFRTFLRVKPPPSLGDATSASAAFDTDGDDDDASSCSRLKFFVEEETGVAGEAAKRLELEVPLSAEPGLIHSHTTGFVPFYFNDVFGPHADQAEVFSAVRDMLVDAFLGINCTVLAYGQTGTGKTFSISGGDSYAERGLIPRGVKLVFDEAKARGLTVTDSASNSQCDKDACCSFYISFTEIYGEGVYDLLDPGKRHRPLEEWSRAQVLETEDGLVIRNVNVFQVHTAEDAMNLFFMGSDNRLTSATVMNKASSRSHAVFTIVVETHHIENGSHITHCGKINFVDLAGSERIYKEINSKEIIKEGKSINLSLHYLEQVIIALRLAHHQQHRRRSDLKSAKYLSHSTHIPYRNCILTSILRDSLGGNCRSCFLFTISMDTKQFEETVSTCRFAQRVGEIKVRIVANQDIDVFDQLNNMKKYVHEIEEKVRGLELERDQLKNQLEMSGLHLQGLEDKHRSDRVLSIAEAQTNKAFVANILSGNLPPFLIQSQTPTKTYRPEVLSGDRRQSGGSAVSLPPPVSRENAVASVVHPSISPRSPIKQDGVDLFALDRAALVDLCTELARSLATVNTEKNNAVALQSQTSSSAAAFVAQRFAGKTRRQSFNKAQTRSNSNISVTPPGVGTGGNSSFGALNYSPSRGVANDKSPNSGHDQQQAVTPGAVTPGALISTIDPSPQQSAVAPGPEEAVIMNLQRDVDDEALSVRVDNNSCGADLRDRADSDASGITGVAVATSEENDILKKDTSDDTLRRNDAFIDMLVFGDQFLKHGRRGVCGRSLRHVSVSQDLKFLCRSHINNLNSTKSIALTDIERVEVGHGFPKLKNRENCLLSVICRDMTLDLECFCYETFQENKIFAENWAMGLSYCIANAKGQLGN